MLKTLVLIGVGGALGSVSRYLSNIWISKYLPSIFPWGTFFVNLLGCLIIGLILGYLERQQLGESEIKFFFATGFCGAFTTFSAFASENMNLMNNGDYFLSILYIAASIILGILAVYSGFGLAK